MLRGVFLEDFEWSGDRELTGAIILAVEETKNRIDEAHKTYGEGVQDWTFYNIKTDKGDLNLRFVCCSSGHYSAMVNFMITALI